MDEHHRRLLDIGGSGGSTRTQTKWGLVFKTGIIKWAPFWKGSNLMQIYGKFEGVSPEVIFHDPIESKGFGFARRVLAL